MAGIAARLRMVLDELVEGAVAWPMAAHHVAPARAAHGGLAIVAGDRALERRPVDGGADQGRDGRVPEIGQGDGVEGGQLRHIPPGPRDEATVCAVDIRWYWQRHPPSHEGPSTMHRADASSALSDCPCPQRPPEAPARGLARVRSATRLCGRLDANQGLSWRY